MISLAEFCRPKSQLICRGRKTVSVQQRVCPWSKPLRLKGMSSPEARMQDECACNARQLSSNAIRHSHLLPFSRAKANRVYGTVRATNLADAIEESDFV